MTERTGRRWSLVQAEVSRETNAGNRIADDLGYLTYVPQFQTEVWNRRKHRRKERVLRPLFPGYLFALFDPDRDAWGSIERTPGVLRIVRSGSQPTRVPLELVEQLQAAESSGHVERLEAAIAEFKPGERLLVRSGPFADAIVLFVKRARHLDGEARIMALLELLGRQVSIELSIDQVARA